MVVVAVDDELDGVPPLEDRAQVDHLHAGLLALIQQCRHDQLRRLPAKQLPAEAIDRFFFEVPDIVALDEFDEVPLRVAAQRALAEMGIGRKVAVWGNVQVGEIAAAATRHQDFFADLVRAIQHGHAAAATGGRYGAHQAGGAGSENQRVRHSGRPVNRYRHPVLIQNCADGVFLHRFPMRGVVEYRALVITEK